MSNEKKFTFNVQIIRGMAFPPPPFYKKETIESSLNHIPKDDDIMIASYPKCGTTWLQYIVLQIISKGKNYPTFDDLQMKVSPYMELAGVEAIDQLENPRTYKHHFPYEFLPSKNPNAKCLYIYRDPADTLVSNYYFQQNLRGHKIDFDNFFELFLSGEIPHGSYWDHVLTYYQHRDESNLLMVSYEDLHRDRRGSILQIAKFLGDDYYRTLSKDPLLLDQILDRTSFKHMQKNLFLTKMFILKQQGRSARDDSEKVPFFRKGIVGDGKNHLSAEQMQRLQETVEKCTKGMNIFKF